MIVALIATSLLAGCGYQLKGTNSALSQPIDVTLRSDAPQVGIVKSLTPMLDQLQADGAPKLMVDLANAQINRRALSYDSGVSAAQYAIEMVVWVTVTNQQGKQLATMQPMRATAVYSYDRNYALAKEHEQRLVEAGLADQLAKQIVTLCQMLAQRT